MADYGAFAVNAAHACEKNVHIRNVTFFFITASLTEYTRWVDMIDGCVSTLTRPTIDTIVPPKDHCAPMVDLTGELQHHR